jgi:copper resistance protein B
MDHSKMGHDMGNMPGMQPMDHSAMSGMSMAPTEPIIPIPVLTDADRAAAAPPPHDHPAHDNSIQSYVLFDRLEAWNADNGTGLEWEGQSWIGTDLNRLWLRSEGERVDGRTVSADLEVLYGRSFSPWWDVVTGIRHDFKPGGSQDFAAIGVMGLAPYKFEVAATGYLGESGQTAARVEVEYETLLTNRLILQPLLEVNLYGKDDPRRGIGSGLSTVEAGLRLRYEITRQFAPYIGLVRERAFGTTADLRRDDGEDIDDTRLVAGFRIWF